MKTLTIVFFVLMGFASRGQTLSNYAILSSADSFDLSELKGNSSTGQVATTTLSSSTLIVTQGILQGEIPEEITSLPQALDISNELRIYPNPASTFFNLKINNSEVLDFQIKVFDMQGNMITNGKTDQQILGDTRIDFETHKAGLYIVQVVSSDNLKQGFLKVLKKD